MLIPGHVFRDVHMQKHEAVDSTEAILLMNRFMDPQLSLSEVNNQLAAFVTVKGKIAVLGPFNQIIKVLPVS